MYRKSIENIGTGIWRTSVEIQPNNFIDFCRIGEIGAVHGCAKRVSIEKSWKSKMKSRLQKSASIQPRTNLSKVADTYLPPRVINTALGTVEKPTATCPCGRCSSTACWTLPPEGNRPSYCQPRGTFQASSHVWAPCPSARAQRRMLRTCKNASCKLKA